MANADSKENVLIVEDGNVYMYTLVDPDKGYVRSNLIGKTICPKNIINCIPAEILKSMLQVCNIFSTPQLIYLYNNKWNTKPIIME